MGGKIQRPEDPGLTGMRSLFPVNRDRAWKMVIVFVRIHFCPTLTGAVKVDIPQGHRRWHQEMRQSDEL